MPYYHTCPDCGSNLDPGERCDCREQIGRLPERAPCSRLHDAKQDNKKAHCPPVQR